MRKEPETPERLHRDIAAARVTEGALRHRLWELEIELASICASRTWRLLSWLTAHVPGVRLCSLALAWNRRRRRTRPAALRALYARHTAPGRPFETVLAVAAAPGPDGCGAHPADRIRQDRYAHGAARLREGEWAAIRQAPPRESSLPGWVLRELLRLREPWPEPVDSNRPPDRFLLDARALQLPYACGTQTHGLNVAREICAFARERGIPMDLLTSPDYPPLDNEFSDWPAVYWHSGLPDRVRVFFQLTPFIEEPATPVADLFRAPWVRCVVVWLDAIMALYPRSFLRGGFLFWRYQLGIEKLAMSDHLLSISDTATAEARRMLGDRADIRRVPCRGNLPAVAASGSLRALPFQRYVLAMGNWLPHKNLFAALAGYARLVALSGSASPGWVVAARLSPEQRRALLVGALDLGVAASRLYFAEALDDPAFAVLLSGADAAVIPSFHEGFSLPAVEAIEAGTPVVLSDIPAHRALMDLDPFLFAPDDPAALGDCLRHVLMDPAGVLCRQRERLRERYDPAALARNLAEFLPALAPDGKLPLTRTERACRLAGSKV